MQYEKANSKNRCFVPDFSPRDRALLRTVKPRWVFVAESPHVSEIEPESIQERRPLCGAAGKKWWSLLSEILEGKPSAEVSAERLTQFCRDHEIAVLNAVQLPLDPKIASRFSFADPLRTLGFSKGPGANSYKKLKNSSQVQEAIRSLKVRLQDSSLSHLKIHCLGNDATWFVTQALGPEAHERLADKIPHPSAWWRRGGEYGRIANNKLRACFKSVLLA